MYTLKKSLGQHFLRDENIIRKILQALQQTPFTQLLEVGPGGGALTRYLIALPGVDCKAVELDKEKVEYLLQQYPLLQGRLLHQNFLEMDIPFTGSFTVVGNFPYNISSQILFRLLDWREQVETMVGMFQKEVAQRAAAAPGSKTYGVLSVLVQAFFTVDYLFDVAPGCFDPPPKVMSGVIRLTPRQQVPAMRSQADFTLLVKTAFGQRRKTLRNALKPLFDTTVLQDPLFDKRAEQLSVEQFGELSFRMLATGNS
ncbi:MAG: ribosomal RNA small subunit methyltransferase A [Chitinophagia bacterium]|nr:ribosomal RNA small subunit methyltransferase A [Chitinophagia bacterium]